MRRNVGFYFKDITSPYSYQKAGKNDVATFANGWQKGMVVSTTQSGSAYSTFTLQEDGRLGFFYEETPGGYSMVYVPLTISEITGGKYVRIVGDAQPTDAAPMDITYTYKYGDTEWYTQSEVAYVGENFPPVYEPAYVSTNGVPERKATAEDAGKNFVISCTLSEDIPFLPSVSFDQGVWYSLTIRGTKYPYYNASTGKFPCATSKQTGDKTLFAFVGNPYTGYKIQILPLARRMPWAVPLPTTVMSVPLLSSLPPISFWRTTAVTLCSAIPQTLWATSMTYRVHWATGSTPLPPPMEVPHLPSPWNRTTPPVSLKL